MKGIKQDYIRTPRRQDDHKETLDFNTDNKDTEIVKHFDGLFISSNADGS